MLLRSPFLSTNVCREVLAGWWDKSGFRPGARTYTLGRGMRTGCGVMSTVVTGVPASGCCRRHRWGDTLLRVLHGTLEEICFWIGK